MGKGSAAPDHQGHGLPVLTFEVFLEYYFTKKLNKCPHVNEDCEVRIANITFGFANQDLIGILRKRGGYCAEGKFEKVPELNKEIEKMCQDNFDDFTRPVAAFLTFER